MLWLMDRPLLSQETTEMQMFRENVLDRCTIISLLPFDIREIKPTTTPREYFIKAAAEKDFSILVVGPSYWFQEMGEERPAIRVPSSSVDVAEAVVNDFNG